MSHNRMTLPAVVMAFSVFATEQAFAGTEIVPVDFSACANATPTDPPIDAPVGLSPGNAGTPDARLRFNLLDPRVSKSAWGAGAPNASIDIKVSVKSPVAVYVLLNTFFGQANQTNAIVTLKGTEHTAKTFRMVGNTTIRDYNNDGWTNSINGTSTQEWLSSGNQRIDAHKFNIATLFAGHRLTDIVVLAPATAGLNHFLPVLFAVDIARSANAGGTIVSSCTTQ